MNKQKCATKKISLLLVPIIIGIFLISCDEQDIAKEFPNSSSEEQFAEIHQETESIEDFIEKTPILKIAVVEPNFGLFQTLKSVGLDLKQSLKIINTLADTVELGTLKAGQIFWVGFDEKDTSKAILFRYEENLAVSHFLIADSAGEWTYKIFEKPVNVRYAMYEGVLHEGGNLYNILKEIGIPQSMVGIVAGVLECKVNFRTDARLGDKFKILLKETRFQDSIWIGGKVLYASYYGSKVKHSEAFLYEEADPKSSFNAHYAEDGEALIHSALRYPLDRLHITSRYGGRIHPVLGTRAFHSGVDYRGAPGTPVYAVADGYVAQSSFNNESGNFIAIKHSDNSQSFYLHLSQRNVKQGQRIKGRQLIGRVGNTGRSSGPHLHFAIKQPNGSWMNPLLKRMIATPKLTGEKFQALKIQVQDIRKIIKKTETAKPRKIEGSSATVKWIDA